MTSSCLLFLPSAPAPAPAVYLLPCLVHLIRGHTSRSLKASHFEDLHAAVTNLGTHTLQDVFRKVLRRRLQLMKWRQLVNVLMIQVLHYFIGSSFQLNKINQQPNVIQFATTRVNFNSVIVAV